VSASAESPRDISDRLKLMFHDLFYDNQAGLQTNETINQNTLLAPQKSGEALVIARISDASVPHDVASRIVQQFLSKASGAGIKFVTIEDLTGTAREAGQGKVGTGGMQSFASDQQAIQFAASQGIPSVLTLSLESWNVRPAQTAAGMFLGNARGTASLISNGDGVRTQTADFSASARSFNEQQIAEKLLVQLASGLAGQVNAWHPPAAATNVGSTCEVHAKVDGLIMPSFVMQNGTPQFNTQSIPVYASGANVELDGILVGQTPCAITAGRGMHEIKISREGLKPYSAMINLTGQNRYDITLAPSDETLAKFNEQMAYIRKLNQNEKVTDAQIKVLEGYAKMLRQSGYRIDQRSVSDWGHLSVDKQDAANK
jgi:PEGA domain